MNVYGYCMEYVCSASDINAHTPYNVARFCMSFYCLDVLLITIHISNKIRHRLTSISRNSISMIPYAETYSWKLEELRFTLRNIFVCNREEPWLIEINPIYMSAFMCGLWRRIYVDER